MPGSLVDLNQPEVSLPARIAVDSSLLIPGLLAVEHAPMPITVAHAGRFFRLLAAAPALAVVPPTAYTEVLHFALKSRYRNLLAAHRVELTISRPKKHGFAWLDLYKLRPDLIVQFLSELELLPRLLRGNGLAVLQPTDLRPLPGVRLWEEELTRLVGRYQLDTSDAAILLEAQRAGVMSIATLDADFHRAASDFDVYTWL